MCDITEKEAFRMMVCVKLQLAKLCALLPLWTIIGWVTPLSRAEEATSHFFGGPSPELKATQDTFMIQWEDNSKEE